MKKYILIIMLLFTIPALAQWTGQKNTVSTFGKYTVMKNGDSVATMNYLPQLEGIEDILQTTTPSSNSYGVLRTTTGTTIDSVAFGFDTQTITFINDGTTSDTLYVSTSSNFPATNVMVRLGGEGFTKRMKTNKLYFKVGNVPLAGKKIRIEGY